VIVSGGPAEGLFDFRRDAQVEHSVASDAHFVTQPLLLPAWLWSSVVADSAARAARLQRDGLGERAAARVVAWAEMTAAGRERASANQLAAGERRVRQRLDRALEEVGDALGNPSSFAERLGKAGAICHCEKWPYYRWSNGEVPAHSHCAWCDVVIADGSRFCGKELCHRAAYWGSEDAAEAARAEARAPKNADPATTKGRSAKVGPSQRPILELPSLSERELLDRWDKAQSTHTPLSKTDVAGILGAVPAEGTDDHIREDDRRE
jgi:hypothetical protein